MAEMLPANVEQQRMQKTARDVFITPDGVVTTSSWKSAAAPADLVMNAPSGKSGVYPGVSDWP